MQETGLFVSSVRDRDGEQQRKSAGGIGPRFDHAAAALGRVADDLETVTVESVFRPVR